MMDERTIAAAEATTERQRQQAIENGRRLKQYTIVVLGTFEREPLQIMASGAQDRADQMGQHSINLNKDHWAAGHFDHNRQLQVCGNDEKAKQLVRDHLRNKR